MGSRYIEISKNPSTYEQFYDDRKNNIIVEGSVWILDKILISMPKAVRVQFPMLLKIKPDSVHYEGEDLILNP